MTADLLLLAAAVVSVIMIFAGVVILGDFQHQPGSQEIKRNRRERAL